MKARFLRAAVPVMGIFAWGLLPGCEVGSVDNAVPNSSGGFSGIYSNPNGGAMVTKNSGSEVTSLNITQFGDELNGVDNNGILFKGTLNVTASSSTSSTSSATAAATFSLQGSTTAGAQVTITGNLSAVGSTATMNGIWIEPNINSTIYGTTSITPSSSLTISPSSASLTTNLQTATFTASGGTPPYAWTLSNTNGTLNASSGATVIYTCVVVGDNELTLTDNASHQSVAVILP